METLSKACRTLNLNFAKNENEDFAVIKRYSKEVLIPKKTIPGNDIGGSFLSNDKHQLSSYLKNQKMFFIPTFVVKHPRFNKTEVSSLIETMNYLSENTQGIIVKNENDLFYATRIDQIENAWLELFKYNHDKIYVSPFYKTMNEWRLFAFNGKIYSCLRKLSRRKSWYTNMEEVVEEGDLMLVANHLKPIVNKAMQKLKLKCATIDIMQLNKDELDDKALGNCDDFGFMIFDVKPFIGYGIQDTICLNLWIDILKSQFNGEVPQDFNSCVTRMFKRQLLIN